MYVAYKCSGNIFYQLINKTPLVISSLSQFMDSIDINAINTFGPKQSKTNHAASANSEFLDQFMHQHWICAERIISLWAMMSS